jgi:glutamate dehydrogenase
MFARLGVEQAEDFPPARRQAIATSAFDFFGQREEAVKLRAFGAADDALLVVESVMADCPFIVDSLLEYFRARGLPVRTLLHPRFSVSRAPDGTLAGFERGTSSERSESFIHVEIELAAESETCAGIVRDLTDVLNQVGAATEDFAAMTARAMEICEETAAQRGLVEVRDFLRWLVQGGFVFLGYRRYRIAPIDSRAAIVTESGDGLGIMRDDARSRFAKATPIDDLEEGLRRLLFEHPALIVGRTRAETVVHRRAPMDDITLRRCDAAGQPIGFDRFVGLFTSKALAEEAEHVPVLRAKLREVIEAEGLSVRTHDYKALVAAFNSFPKQELFRSRIDELREQLRVVLDVENEAHVRLRLAADAVRGVVTALVIMPRDRFSAEVRGRIQAALATRLAGRLVHYYLALGESYTARLHFCFAAPPPAANLEHELSEEIARLARSWEDLLREHLIDRFGAGRGRELLTRWAPAFTVQYRASTPPELAAGDIEQVESLAGKGRFTVLIGAAAGAVDRETTELRLYEFGEAPILSELVPVLQNFGISVISEEAHEFRLTANGEPHPAYVQAFRAQTLAGEPLESTPGAALLADALVAVRAGQAEDDPLNALTLSAGLTWRETALLRAYLAAAFQMRLAPARPATRRPFLLCPKLARDLVNLFCARFDPQKETPTASAEELRRRYLEELGAIENIGDDRFARIVLAMVEATVRTNYFCTAPTPYIALKFESAKIPNLPDTAPLYEIHVDSPTMAGCHLRSGKIARGGIRYSDRFDDYRTEIIDLMKTQTVKNAIIVPTGAKGGFIVKHPPGRAPDRDAVVAAYSTLIEAMLTLTDNVVEDRVVQPNAIRVCDDDGPYLVVAADKGTAAFSDLANGLAERRGFWLGDAFASGGEHGYDHKRLGITARGAWESAKRHLREVGRDLQGGAPVTVVGIGDMSGDVFGNGMLQSDHLKLIAAFDHRHIFIDPDPQPSKSYTERKRLYETPGSQWSDYSASLISAGGGVFRRGQKRIQLSAAAQGALGCPQAELDADSLVQAILRAPVDLLYNGGIGTYVRAESESDAEIGDHANDSCRVTATELRCKIVVEGGNLGFTQRARIEYAMAGGRINTDAIDNSAGVDMSDHEVNLKILLQPAMARGALSEVKRNQLLAAVAEEVATNVLRDNRDQALLLSLEQARSGSDPAAFAAHAAALQERTSVRMQLRPPPAAGATPARERRLPGYTRPELAELTAVSKIDLESALIAGKLVDEPYLVDRYLRPYFPAAIANEFAAELPAHGLRRELIATGVANELVDLMGSAFLFDMSRDFEIDTAAAVRAWLIAADVLDLRARANELHRQAAELDAGAEVATFLALGVTARRACARSIAQGEAGRAEPLAAIIERYKPPFAELLRNFDAMLVGTERERFERTYRELRAAVQQEALALELARLSFADHLLNILDLSFSASIEPAVIAAAYFGVSARLDFPTLEAAIDALRAEDRWERRAATDLRTELAWAHNRLCRARVKVGGNGVAPAVAASMQREGEIARLMRELHAMPAAGLAPIQVTVRAIARLASSA